MKEYYCPNCGTKNKFVINRERAFTECVNCGKLIRYQEWRKNNSIQVVGYVDG